MERTADTGTRRLRIALFTVLPLAHWLLQGWATEARHEVALVVTTPGPAARRGNVYREVIAQVPPEQDALVTIDLRRSLPAIAAYAPDLLVTFAFPFRLPAILAALPTLGAYNLHPAPLPRYRGPNPQRMLFEGAPTVGAALHRLTPRIDAGPILSRHERPIAADAAPEEVTRTWVETMRDALVDGVARGIAGEPGEPQDEAAATYAARFTEEEYWLDWSLPALTLQRRALALNLFGVQARGVLAGQPHAILHAATVAAPAGGPPGTILTQAGNEVVVRAGEGALHVVALPLDRAMP